MKLRKETCMCDISEAEFNNLKEKEMHAQNLYAEASKKLDLAVSQANSLKKELETTFDVNLVLLQKNEELQKRVDGLTKDLEKLTKGKQNLDALLGNQLFANGRQGLGYKNIARTKKYENYFIKASSLLYSHATCFYCNHSGHIVKFCAYKKNASKANFVWVPKGTRQTSETNLIGPKLVWVPKSK